MGFIDKWVGRVIRLTDGAFWKGFFGFGTTSGEKVTYETALQSEAVWACTTLISDTVGTLSCVVYGADGVTEDRDSPLFELLHYLPNMDDTAPDFWSQVALCVCLDGNFFAEIKRNGSGAIVALNPHAPLAVDVQRNSRNERVYEVTEDGGTKRRISEKNMFHVRGKTLPGCDRGLSPIEYAKNTVGNALAGEKAVGRMMKSGLMASLIVSSDQILNPEQRKQIGDVFAQFAGADKAGGVLPLEGGMKPYPMSINPKDAQLLESRQYIVEQICRVYGIPPVMVGGNNATAWGSGIEQLILQFTKTCMRPMLKRIEYAIYRDLLTPEQRKTVKVKFNMEDLLRGDSAARAEFLTKLVNSGIYHVDEARAYEGKPPTAGGDKSIVNGTMQRLDQIGVAANQNTAAPAPARPAA
ncbi:MAG TPA: phage portal protein [Pelagibacterium sp.]|uniref:phage portal protein n=1 Tax=Pelagibacterium sp. TaxID=1967288 RepID=UPI002C12231D|nr:phage portal protein [Pelagibacterium sp.]HWJ89084.1 phage portal protein [Pelagibacterium sp.]